VIDQDTLLSKASRVEAHLRRIRQKREVSEQEFLQDTDRQDILLFNIQMAIQSCIDIAAHIVSDQGLGVPGSTNEIFYLLEDNGYITADLTEKMVAAVGFRNLIVHEYGKLDLQLVYRIANKDIHDLQQFLQNILARLQLI
jgi:uncharacterized protein YutE (UPF0331/DUF86 family)